MSTKPNKTRTTINLFEEDKKILEELSEVTGESVANLVCEMMHSAAPTMKSTLEAVIDARNDEERALNKLSGILTQAESDVRQMHIDCEVERKTRVKKKGRK